MTGLVTAKMQCLAASIADLKVRVRHALAAELAEQIATAVADVVRAVIAGREFPGYRSSQPSAWREEIDPWDDVDVDAEDGYRRDEPRPVDNEKPTMNPAMPLAVAAGIHAVRWWIGRRGTLLTAVAAGLGVGILGLAGGPLVRAALAAFTAAADLLAVTDALGHAAARLEPI
ncbi:MAG TPA: hypothetical protein VGI99_09320 [Gemmataceae bacterium]